MAAGRVAAVWAVSVGWLLFLSWALGVSPGSPVATRNNVLFQVDVASHSQELVGQPDPFAPGKPRISAPHPLMPQVWGTLGRAASAALSHVSDSEGADLLAGRLMIACVASAGIAALAWFGIALGGPRAWGAAVLALALGSASSAIVCLPDHFGLSFGLLVSMFVGAWAYTEHRCRCWWWTWAAALLAVATTSTNVVFALLVLSWMHGPDLAAAWGRHAREPRWRAGAAIALVLASTAAAVLIPRAVRRVTSGETIATTYFHGNLFHAPGPALAALPLCLVYPTVAPEPRRLGTPDGEVLTLEPWWPPTNVSPRSAAGALAVLALWLWAGLRLVRTPGSARTAAGVVAAWVLFNWAFHSVWGDERFLYSPHWAWALLAVLLLAGRNGPVRAWPWLALTVACYSATHSLADIVLLAATVR